MENTTIKKQAIDSIKVQIRKELGNIEVNSNENLIEKGLSSIMIMKISNKLRKLGIGMSFAKLMENPTINDWEILIQNTKMRNKKKENPVPHQKLKSYTDIEFSLTDVQYAYWIGREDDQVLGGVGCHAYLEIDAENIDSDKLNNAWNTLQDAHPMLRAKFNSNGTQQIMKAPYSNIIGVYDLTSLERIDIKNKLEYIRKQLSHRKLQVEKGEVAGLNMALLPQNKARIFLDVDLLVADVMSLSIMIDDLTKIYNGEYKPSCGYTFKNYIQERKIEQKSFDEDKAYWKEKLKNLPKESPNIPMKKKPEFIESTVFSRRKKIIDKLAWDKIREIAANYKITPSMVLLACYSLILERWTNQDKFMINMPLFNRDTENDNLKHMIADFTNLLLIDYERKNNETFLETVKKVSKTFLENVSHSLYSGVQVQRDIYKEIGSNNNIAPIVFACNIDYSLETRLSKRLFGRINYMISQTPQVWLDFQTYIVDETLVLCWDAVEELYPEGLLDHMFSSLVKLVYDLSENDNWNVIFDVLPEKQRLMREKELKNILPLEYTDKILYSNFVKNVEKSPNVIAIIDAETGKEITYKELYDKALKIAYLLVDNGVVKGDYIGITLPRGFEQICAIFGILFAGAAYVPIGINQPKERRNKIYAQIGIKHIVSNSKTINDFLLNEEKIMPIDIDEISLTENRLDNPVCISPKDTCYVIMTSGTTGVPKGVEICHENAMNTILDINDKYSINNLDIVLMVSSIDFDLSVYDIFGLLSAGGKIVTLSEDNYKDPDLWIELIDKYKITLWNSVPILFDMLVTMAEGKGKHLPLRIVMLSGDWIAINLPSRFYERSEGATVVAMGGATEASVWSNYLDVPKEIPKDWISIPYGKALKNQVYRVVDDFGRICPNYVKGELLIGGVGVAKCYRGDEELTNKKFIYNEIRWYRTGDNGRTWNDGTIEFLGRKDNQVKIKGHRIELGEIEDAIKSLEGIKNSIVCVDKSIQGDSKIIAFVESVNNGCFIKKRVSSIKQIKVNDNDMYKFEDSLLENYNRGKINFYKYIRNTNIICGEFIERTLSKLGIFREIGEKFTFSGIIAKSKVAESNIKIIQDWISILLEDGIVKKEDQYYEKIKNYKLKESFTDEENLIMNYCLFLDKYIVNILKNMTSPLDVFYNKSISMSPVNLEKKIYGNNEKNNKFLILVTKVLENINNKKEIRVLDISNRNLDMIEKIIEILDKYFLNINYTVVDNSLFFKNEFLRGKDDRFNFKKIDLNIELNVDINQFDLIISNNSIHYYDNKLILFKNISRLLKSGGLFIGTEFIEDTRIKNISANLFVDVNLVSNKSVNSFNIFEIAEKTGFDYCKVIPSLKEKYYGYVFYIIQNPQYKKEFDVEKIKLGLVTKLPEYMIPNNIICVENIPITSNGKVDRKRLNNDFKIKDLVIARNKSELRDSLSHTEKIIIDIWKRELDNADIKKNDNYFFLGGDSLIATKIISNISKKFDISISVNELFENPEVSKISLVIDRKLKNNRNNKLLTFEIDAKNKYKEFPLTDVQYAYWIGRDDVYDFGNISTHCYFELKTDKDVKKIQLAWNELIKRHDMLRVVLTTNGKQRILENVETYSIKKYYLKNLDKKLQLSKLKYIREEMSHQILDINKWPIFDVRISLIKENYSIIHISFDNIVLDGWSMFKILSEWNELYNNTNKIYENNNISFRDYVLNLQKIKNTEKYIQDKYFWINKIEDMPLAPKLPTREVNNSYEKTIFMRKSHILNSERWKSLKNIAKHMKVTPTVLLLSAFAEILKLWSEESEITINLTKFDRNIVDAPIEQIDYMVGDFTSLILVEVKDLKEFSFTERTQYIQKQLVEIYEHNTFNTIEILREIRKKTKKYYEAIMPIVFTSGLGIENANDKDWIGELNYMISQTPQTWLDFQVIEKSGDLFMFWDYVEKVFEENVINEMFDSYVQLLEFICIDKDIITQKTGSIAFSKSAIENANSGNTSITLNKCETKGIIDIDKQYCILNNNFNYCPNYVVGNIYEIENNTRKNTNMKGKYLPENKIEVLGYYTENDTNKMDVKVDSGINTDKISLTSTEESIINLWKELLCIKDLDIDSDFFKCGGDSLKAVTLANLYRIKFNIDIPIRVIFKESTVRKISKYIDLQKNSNTSVEGSI